MNNRLIKLILVFLGLFSLFPLISNNAQSLEQVVNGIIAFAAWDGNDYEIYVVNVDGSQLQQLTNNEVDDTWISWSPDGTKITFMSNRTGIFDIYAMDADGSNQINLTNRQFGAFPTWSPDGTKIAFSSGRDGVGDDIFVMDADGTNPVNLTNNPDSFDQRPTWSPDGTIIAFISSREKSGISSNNPGYDLFVIGVDGSNPTKLAFGSFDMTSPYWSPDGSQLVFSMDTLYNHVYIVNADGTDLTILPPLEDINGIQPSWSPDGTKIIFVQFSAGGNDISIMNADGTNLTILLPDIHGVSFPSWQPALISCDSKIAISNPTLSCNIPTATPTG